MKEIIDLFKHVVIQIATPYSTGTGFYLKDYNLIVTNEHVVRGNKKVVIDGETFAKQMVRVLYTDQKFDLAFLEVPAGLDLPAVHFGHAEKLDQGEAVLAVGHPFGLKYSATQGIISNTAHLKEEINYIQHDAALNPGNSGGPLVNQSGEIVGINTFIIRDGDNIGFSLPVEYLKTAIGEFSTARGQVGVRCPACNNIVFEKTIDGKYCPHCGSAVKLPSQEDDYEPAGLTKTIEEMLEKLGHPIELSRRGPNAWEIQQGSARINIAYHEKTGLITCDAYLCLLPQKEIKPLYEYLLRQNYEIEGMTFSVKGQDIILSLLIFDRYLNVDIGLRLFRRLFEKADFYDNILVEQFGAQWKQEN